MLELYSSRSGPAAPDHLGHEDNLIPQIVHAVPQAIPEQTVIDEHPPFEYELLRGHKRTDGSWKTDEQLKMEYVQLTDRLIYDMTHGVEVTDPVTHERRREKPDVVVFLDKSARPLRWLVKDLWSTMAPDSPGGEVPKMPESKFINIDREQWVNVVDPEGVGRVDINIVDKSVIRSLRSVFVEPELKSDGLTEAIDSAPASLDNKTVLIVDEVFATGRTLDIATKFFKRAFPTARIAGTHWMQGTTLIGGASGNKDLPVWYIQDDVTGRGVGNRDEGVSRNSKNTTQKLGSWFLSTRLPKPDPKSQQLRKELRQLAHDPEVLKLPSFSRPDRMERIAWLNNMPTPEVIAKMHEVKRQRYR